jgi:hypothetical protein
MAPMRLIPASSKDLLEAESWMKMTFMKHAAAILPGPITVEPPVCGHAVRPLWPATSQRTYLSEETTKTRRLLVTVQYPGPHTRMLNLAHIGPAAIRIVTHMSRLALTAQCQQLARPGSGYPWKMNHMRSVSL